MLLGGLRPLLRNNHCAIHVKGRMYRTGRIVNLYMNTSIPLSKHSYNKSDVLKQNPPGNFALGLPLSRVTDFSSMVVPNN